MKVIVEFRRNLLKSLKSIDDDAFMTKGEVQNLIEKSYADAKRKVDESRDEVSSLEDESE
jgi:TfoX/Sxy family transcriptional regulator of competence genes